MVSRDPAMIKEKKQRLLGTMLAIKCPHWSDIGTGCPGRWLRHHAWRY